MERDLTHFGDRSKNERGLLRWEDHVYVALKENDVF